MVFLDLHFRMIDIRPQSPSNNKQKNTEIVPNIHQLADLTQNEPILGTNKINKYFSSK